MMFFSRPQHIKLFAKGQVAHHVEAKHVENLCHIDWLPMRLCKILL